MASLELRDIRKTYDKIEVIKGVSLFIRDGEFVAFVGPSGCGKSTLLRMMAGLEDISAGQLRIGARLINDVPSKDRDIAMVFQNYALYPHMTVAGNMSFALELRGETKAEIARRIEKAAAILGLSQLLERLPRQLSGGQRQRVAMGRAIVRDPQVFLFDEPLSNLDAKLRVQMRTEIRQLHDQLKVTMVYVTHDQTEAMTMADRIVILRDGVIEQVGAPLELYDHPTSQFVAGFIGSPSMNFLSGNVAGDGFVSSGGLRLPLPAHGAGCEGQSVVYGIRPENLHLGADGLPFEVVTVEPMGSETQIVARHQKEEVVFTLRERNLPRRGETVLLRADTQHVHLFHADTGAVVQA
ncbi:ABC transporter ATP-binding protein [Verminephrobacter eiseniae]|uniref:ABC transporter related n=1 Tax=Verminephrobacter eiseniae (strain EF01-2) TaxID=391735 RepID=A1WRG3_VEREI|nr:sn-glycerol-3-phosphate ABC transporter ATP-binding protein UgpC [Verminephrobacter eiseniae]ABM60220.1 ABC transporter related [Verminephrobacter eiseniae EF01-2]MCW5285708.1 sn-glycerol-3-phosphate ABC transporter ATP-binding protein UgpC [Verminephrobacter eiseniae]MCW5304008.1 sn-glycerol-3-phosphate ABC transporter ATP-binding protein UgpC [Verminephrobacter eiseniae]MCW8179724.1 sn-glycerol-3-phosphate ABC transporter ATP-binding protein UgpC [Verminephrobacter eiseniae]MCW8190375.1 s